MTHRTAATAMGSVLILAASVIVDSHSALASPPVGAKPPAVIALGDSYISGEAGRWQGNAIAPLPGSRKGTDRAAYLCGPRERLCSHNPQRVYGTSYANGCDRSNGAEITYVYQVQVGDQSYDIAQDDRINVACSGATTESIYKVPFKGEPIQVDQLAQYAQSKDIKLVVLSIGGNDLNVGGVIRSCIKAFLSSGVHCHISEAPLLPQLLVKMQDGVTRALQSIRTTMTNAGYRDSDYRLVLQSYPSPVPPAANNRYPENVRIRLQVGGCPLFNDDSDWAYGTAIRAISDALRQVATTVGGVDFLDLYHALDGHEVCAKGVGQSTDGDSLDAPRSKSDSEWVRWISLHTQDGRVNEAAHPNAYGQQQLGGCLQSAVMVTQQSFECNASG